MAESRDDEGRSRYASPSFRAIVRAGSLIQANAGIVLTDSFSMLPGASVSGFYFSHPDARYFGVGRIDRDQVEDYARRKRWGLAEAERWLAPNLGYERRR